MSKFGQIYGQGFFFGTGHTVEKLPKPAKLENHCYKSI